MQRKTKQKPSCGQEPAPASWLTWKKRKHRKGVRPSRTGSLKVRIIQLPTGDEHREAIDSMSDWHCVEFRAIQGTPPGPELSRRLLNLRRSMERVRSMQKGYGYFREYYQTSIQNVALSAFSDENPEPNTRESIQRRTCEACALAGACPFSEAISLGYTTHMAICAKVRLAVLLSLYETGRPQVLDQRAIAESALQVSMC